ncbi:MAG: hypothetical protein GOV02_03170 [Candidatus Aenigmarchaeota archaeon]|nr:hypothetical protein [Candidatus Aenigmarchaeota archaeon]
MLQGVLNELVSEHFTIADSDGNLVPGVDPASISLFVYNPSGTEVSGSVGGSISELGDGNYKYTFTPDSIGVWYVVATHPTYFPWGKTDDVQVFNVDIDDVYTEVEKTLGLSKHNMFIDDATYDEYGNMVSARVRTYSDPTSVGTSSDVIETYRITADGSECGQFTFWKQVVGP